MKITNFVFAISLCFIGCTEPAIDSDAPSVNAVAKVANDKIVQPIAEKIEPKEKESVNESPVEISEEEKERLAKEKAKEERKRKKEEAYEKASLERKEKRRKARAEKRKRAKEEKERMKKEKESLVIKSVPKEYDSTSSVEEPDELKMQNPDGVARITFKETEYNFGVINQGDKIKHDFVFENIGSGDVEILKVDVTCGCTVPTFPFLPIAPGEKGTISVTYNSTGKLGNQKPMITVVTNAKPHTYKIYLKGVVDAERSKPKEESGSN